MLFQQLKLSKVSLDRYNALQAASSAETLPAGGVSKVLSGWSVNKVPSVRTFLGS